MSTVIETLQTASSVGFLVWVGGNLWAYWRMGKPKR